MENILCQCSQMQLICSKGLRKVQRKERDGLKKNFRLTSSSNEQNKHQRPHDCCVILLMMNFSSRPGLYLQSGELPQSSAVLIGQSGTSHHAGNLTGA